jgi:hypothetical protein
VTEEWHSMEDPIVTDFKFKITSVQDLADSNAEGDDPIFLKLWDRAKEVRKLCDSTSLGEATREQMPHWTTTLQGWLENLGEQLSPDSARDLHNYLEDIERQMKSSSQAN